MVAPSNGIQRGPRRDDSLSPLRESIMPSPPTTGTGDALSFPALTFSHWNKAVGNRAVGSFRAEKARGAGFFPSETRKGGRLVLTKVRPLVFPTSFVSGTSDLTYGQGVPREKTFYVFKRGAVV
jgi:hypothetical protein